MQACIQHADEVFLLCCFYMFHAHLDRGIRKVKKAKPFQVIYSSDLFIIYYYYDERREENVRCEYYYI